jgi:DNA polymerase-3 subunit delta
VKFAEFRKHTPSGQSHVYVFVCEDNFLVEESKATWTRIFGGIWDFEKLTHKEFEAIDSSELMESALSPPLFGPSRAILVTNAAKITKKRLEDFGRIAELGQSWLKIVLVVKSRRAVIRAKPPIPVIEIDPLRAGDTVRWLRDQYGVSSDVARYLVDNLGTELQMLHAEMEKLTIYLRGARPPEIVDVDQLILRSEQFGPFELDDAFLGGDYSRAVRVVGAMVDEGVVPVLILSRIVRVWRQIFVGKVLEGRALPGEIAKAASVPPWKAATFVNACKRFQWKGVVEGFEILIRADRAFKTSSPNPEFYFDAMLWKLMR